jgi:glycosyltransferase involved in cell wall biosynthesis
MFAATKSRAQQRPQQAEKIPAERTAVSREVETATVRIPRGGSVLLVTHDFPPFRSSGVYRTTGMTKYLPGAGWRPTVLAARAGRGEQDPGLLGRVPADVRIVRTRSAEFIAWENAAARALQNAGALRASDNNGQGERQADRWLRSMAGWLRSCLYFPDESIGWVPFASVRAARLFRRERFDVVYTSGPPRSTAIVGLALQAMFGMPWVMEFRDPWYPASGERRKRYEDRLQGLLLRRADAVVVATQGHAERLEASYELPAEKLTVIPNGFDEDDFDFREQLGTGAGVAGGSHRHLSHFGTVYAGHSGKFFPALAELATEQPELASRLRLNIIGYPDQDVLRYASDPRLQDLIHVRGFMPHADALRMMRAADGLLLFLGDLRFCEQAISGKTYEYLRTGRPVLAVAYEGGVKQLIEEGKAGWVVDPEDTEGIKRALRAFLTETSGNGNPPRPARPEFVAQFRYDRLAERLAEIFDKVARHGE